MASVCVRFVIPRDARALELGTIKVSLKVFDPSRTLESLRKAQAEVRVAKAARTTKVLSPQDSIHKLKVEPMSGRKTTGVICKAVTLSGAPCKARASCGAYCKRHFFVSK
jgi:hypothetical protein